MLEAIFEADLDPEAYGYRPGRSAVDAVKRVHGHLRAGYTDVVDADLSKYFDTIWHDELIQCVARRISDGPISNKGGAGPDQDVAQVAHRREGQHGRQAAHRWQGCKDGHAASCPARVPHDAGVISPLLANIYMNRFLKSWHQNDLGRRLVMPEARGARRASTSSGTPSGPTGHGGTGSGISARGLR